MQRGNLWQRWIVTRCALVALITVLSAPLTVQSFAQELTNCLVEFVPCGTPEHLARLLRECARDPSICGDRRNNTDTISDAGQRKLEPIPFVPKPSLSTKQQASANRLPMSLPENSADTLTPPAQASFSAVDATAHDLPLDHSSRELSDALPSDAAAVELRLGLRRPQVAGLDMRDRTPSSAEIVQALAPRKRSP